MSIRADPENSEMNTLLDLVDLDGKTVLEIGSGTGRLTWKYAGKTAHVTAVEPSGRSVAIARRDIPLELRDRVEFQQAGFDEYANSSASSSFDVAILSWSL